jgi:hypothetical protein
MITIGLYTLVILIYSSQLEVEVGEVI